jgi:hypothetical protein
LTSSETATASASALAPSPSSSLQVDHKNAPVRSPKQQSFQQLPEQPIPGSAVRLNEEQMAKLQSEFDVVDNNVLVMNELLNEFQTMDKMNFQSNEVKKDIVLLRVKFCLSLYFKDHIIIANE